MKYKLMFPLVLVALVGVACGGDDGRRGAQQSNYETVQEGSAAGVTSTIQGPGEALPPITGTNADTTTAFTLDPNVVGTAPAPQPPNAVAGAIPPTTFPPPQMSSSPAPQPAPARPVYVPPPSQPQPRPMTPRPAPPQPRPEPQPAPEQPEPAPPTQTAPPPPPTQTDTAPPPTQTDTAPQQEPQQQEEPEEAEPPPPPPTQTDTRGN